MPTPKEATPDEVCERHSDESVGLSLRMLEDNEPGPRIVLIEGRSEALRMLAELLRAVASDTEGDGFSISPGGPGSFHFAPTSELGIYIYRTPE